MSVLTALKGLVQADTWLSKTLAQEQEPSNSSRVLAVVPELRVDNM
jgi:hypothetical protein